MRVLLSTLLVLYAGSAFSSSNVSITQNFDIECRLRSGSAKSSLQGQIYYGCGYTYGYPTCGWGLRLDGDIYEGDGSNHGTQPTFFINLKPDAYAPNWNLASASIHVGKSGKVQDFIDRLPGDKRSALSVVDEGKIELAESDLVAAQVSPQSFSAEIKYLAVQKHKLVFIPGSLNCRLSPAKLLSRL